MNLTEEEQTRIAMTLLFVDVGDWVAWDLGSCTYEGKVERIYPNGKGQYEGPHNAFMMVKQLNGGRNALSLYDETLRKTNWRPTP